MILIVSINNTFFKFVSTFKRTAAGKNCLSDIAQLTLREVSGLRDQTVFFPLHNYKLSIKLSEIILYSLIYLQNSFV